MKKGFTLIELIAVVVVLAIISLVSIPIITGIVNKVRVNALRVSAEGLIDASRLYNAQYQNDNTVRFDIANSKISSEDTDKLLKYKGEIKAGTVIIDSRGRSVICVTDGKHSAYKNYSENVVTVSNNKACSVPAGGSIVYLGNEATITELSNQELTQQLSQAQSKIVELEAKITTLEGKSQSSNYTTDEHVVGTWIDGKPIYEKTIHYTSSPFRPDGEFVVGNISNIENIVDSRVITTGNSGNNQETGWFIARYNKSNNNIIVVNAVSGYSNITRIDVVLQYTKTTD